MDIFLGYFLYAMSLLTVGGIYALLALGLNVQWGFAGLFNAGVAGFAAIGAYTYALLTTAESKFHCSVDIVAGNSSCRLLPV